MEDSRVGKPFSHVGPGPVISFLCLSSSQLIKTDVSFYINNPAYPSSLFEACGYVGFPGLPTPCVSRGALWQCGSLPAWPVHVDCSAGWEVCGERPAREGIFSARRSV